MTTNRFPLFRLPFLALCEILDFNGPHEVIQLLLCSKQGLRVAKKCWRKQEKVKADVSADIVPTVNLYFYDAAFYYRFAILEAKDLQDELTHNVRVGDAVVPSIHKDTETVTYWDDKIIGIEQVVRHINDLFDVPITSVDLKSEEYENEFIDTMDCIMSRQESVQDYTLHAEDFTEECLTHLLDSCKITGELRIYGEPTRQFRNDWNIHLDSIYISNGSSLTFQNLTNINCKSLELYRSILTSEDVNQFLKDWQNGEHSCMRYISIDINSMDHDIIKSGIETVPQPETQHKVYPLMRNSSIVRSGGLDIMSKDGRTGTIYLVDDSFGFGVDPIEVFSD
ncbi:unnamed protein product [Caenorhabditis brenneri]